MAVFDCFTFFNEVEMVKFRIKYLKDVVDYFVIVEASQTHSGMPKEQNFPYDDFDEETKKKIKYVYIDFPKENLLDHLDFNAEYILQTLESWKNWARENYQRNYIKKCLTEAKDDDIILISDVDEIISKEAIEFLKENAHKIDEGKNISLVQIPFYFSIYNPFRYSADENTVVWPHPKATLFKNMIRPNVNRMCYAGGSLKNAGWHLGYFGGNNRLKIKKSSVATHSDEESDVDEKVNKNISNKEAVLAKTKRIPKEILQAEFKLPDLIFDEEFIDFFKGDVL